MLTVNDLMTVDPHTVQEDMSLRSVLGLMKEENCRQLPVLNKNNRLVGIITDRDVRLALNSPIVFHEYRQDDALLDSVVVSSCMTPDPITVTPETSAYRAAKMLSVYKLGALPVVDDERLVGIISVTDILEQFAAKDREPFVLDLRDMPE